MSVYDVSDPGSFERLRPHPLASKAHILLTSIFGPYARNDEFGSRILNPMELYHNQVTRSQGVFSLRMFHRSCALKMIQANIDAPCRVLDYPDLDRFIAELRTKPYDIIGISAIPCNLKKVRKMCGLIREHQPRAEIVVGGHISNIVDLEKLIDADYIVRGEGIRWFRKFLGQEEDAPICHPHIISAINPRCMGLNLGGGKGNTAAVLIPSVGCPVGCNFCSTSAMFGGKGKYVPFYKTGDELFDVMCGLEEGMGVRSFMVMDENFLLPRKRTLRLLELMESHEKSWSLYIFSSADVLQSYTMEQLVGLGIAWVWIGLESKNVRYPKLQGLNTFSLVRELQANGILVLGSTIIGLEHHSPENIQDVIQWAVHHKTDFHQFMLYTAVHGTPLSAELEKKGALLPESELEEADAHGQYRFNYRHPHFKPGQETHFLEEAFLRDFEANGPSVLRMMRTLLQGWKKHKNHLNPRIRKRFAIAIKEMPTLYAGALWASHHWFEKNPEISGKIKDILDDIHSEFGLKSRFAAPVIGRYILHSLRKEERRLAAGATYEPPTSYESSAEAFRPTGRA
ncbi:MAG: cobalamin-dependent protein [Deltaproteobacteria bacterium]|nr:cobalamin-dependent protein [Deltaproteobacteria bacterium]